jgi:hypothetical protein
MFKVAELLASVETDSRINREKGPLSRLCVDEAKYQHCFQAAPRVWERSTLVAVAQSASSRVR